MTKAYMRPEILQSQWGTPWKQLEVLLTTAAINEPKTQGGFEVHKAYISE
jgi:hypothetical protein